MNKSLLLLGTLTLTAALASCGTAPQRIYTEAEPPARLILPLTPPNPTNVNVFVTASNFIVVDQEPVRPPGDPVVIYFSLDDQGGKYAYPPDTVSPTKQGIYIKESTFTGRCLVLTPSLVRCKYPRPPAGTIYHYGINVLTTNLSTAPTPTPLDPSIMN